MLTVLANISAFLGLPQPEDRLALSLLAPANVARCHPVTCRRYPNDAAKRRDLHAAFIGTLAARPPTELEDKPAGEPEARASQLDPRLSRPPPPFKHSRLRSWQLCQPWYPVDEPPLRDSLAAAAQAGPAVLAVLRRLHALSGAPQADSDGTRPAAPPTARAGDESPPPRRVRRAAGAARRGAGKIGRRGGRGGRGSRPDGARQGVDPLLLIGALRDNSVGDDSVWEDSDGFAGPLHGRAAFGPRWRSGGGRGPGGGPEGSEGRWRAADSSPPYRPRPGPQGPRGHGPGPDPGQGDWRGAASPADAAEGPGPWPSGGNLPPGPAALANATRASAGPQPGPRPPAWPSLEEPPPGADPGRNITGPGAAWGQQAGRNITG